MRIDKYLKVARIIKRRTIANEACDADRIMANGRVVKASYEVKIGDIIEVTLGGRKVKVQVESITETIGKAGASDLYRVIE